LQGNKGFLGLDPLKTFRNLSRGKQERITNIAIDEFSEKGFYGTSINAIVQRLGIAKGSIFQYFGDKHGLFRFVFNTSMEQVKHYLKTVRNETIEDDLFLRLEKTLLAGVTFIQQHPSIYKLYLKILFEPEIPYRREMLLSLREYSLEYIQSLLETAQERAEIRAEINLGQAAFMIDAVMDRFLQARTIAHLDAGVGIYGADLHDIHRRVSALIDMIRKGMGPQ
jgi:AcrR family transcriptional regulator